MTGTMGSSGLGRTTSSRNAQQEFREARQAAKPDLGRLPLAAGSRLPYRATEAAGPTAPT